MRKTYIISMVFVFMSGCVAGYSEYNDGLTALKEGRKDDAKGFFAKGCEVENADACFEQANLTNDKAEANSLLQKSCNKNGHLAACHTLGKRLASSDVKQSKEAFIKACVTPHFIVQPNTSEEDQREMEAIQKQGGAAAGLAGGLAKAVSLSNKLAPEAMAAAAAEACRQYHTALDMKLESCKQAGIAKPAITKKTRYDGNTNRVVEVPEGTACSQLAH